MGLARLRSPRAVFIDVGGPLYDDDNFLRAATIAVDELRAESGLAPVDAAAGARRVRRGAQR